MIEIQTQRNKKEEKKILSKYNEYGTNERGRGGGIYNPLDIVER